MDFSLFFGLKDFFLEPFKEKDFMPKENKWQGRKIVRPCRIDS